MLPHLILCDRITSVSVALRELIQDVDHSERERERERERGKRGRDGEGKRGGWVTRSERWKGDEDFFCIQDHRQEQPDSSR